VTAKLMRLLVWFMIVLLPASAMASEAVGLMTVNGSVLLDRHAVTPGSSAIFAGDRIDTKAGGKALVTRPGASIVVQEKSSVVVGSNGISLDSGTVMVSARQGIVAKVDNATITIRPGEPGKFLARRIDGELQVLTLEGQIYVSDGQEQTPVPATKGVALPTDKSAGQAGKGLSWLSNADIGILIVVAAAVTAGVTLGIVNAENSKPASPSVP
jgi:hypothetical protein